MKTKRNDIGIVNSMIINISQKDEEERTLEETIILQLYQSMTEYKKWGASAPPPAEYFPDPSLPTGQKKQIDWAVGGLRTQFTHTITSAKGEVLEKNTYTSNYKTWSAKYLVGQ